MIAVRKSGARNGPKRTPFKSGDKFNVLPYGQHEEDSHRIKLNNLIEERFDAVAVEKVKPERDLGLGVWAPNERLVMVSKVRGKHQYFGFKDSTNRQFYYPEEALFLLEAGDLIVTHNDMPLSIQEAYTVMMSSRNELDNYAVFARLLRQGYHVRRHGDNLVVPNEESKTRTDVQSGKSSLKRGISDDADEATASKRHRSDSLVECGLTSQSTENTVKHRIEPLTLDMVRHRDYVAIPIVEHQKANAANWKDFKDLETGSSSELKASVLDMNGLKGDNLERLVPTAHLFSGQTIPVINPTSVHSAADLYRQLKSKGPKNGHLLPCNSKHSITYKLYLTSNGTPNYGKPDAFVVVVNSDHDGPIDLSDVILLNSLVKSSGGFLLFAVIEEATVSFFKLTPFELWEEIPERWLEMH